MATKQGNTSKTTQKPSTLGTASPMNVTVSRPAVKLRGDNQNKQKIPLIQDVPVVLDSTTTSVGDVSLQLQQTHLSSSMDNEQANTPPTTNDSLEQLPTNSQPTN